MNVRITENENDVSKLCNFLKNDANESYKQLKKVSYVNN